jgi:hypothetical protein
MDLKDIAQILSLYDTAKAKLRQCISDEENQFLKGEVGIPLENILIIESEIKIVFSQRITEHFLIEISLLLFDGNKKIGKYLYIENEKGEAVDDALVFH